MNPTFRKILIIIILIVIALIILIVVLKIETNIKRKSYNNPFKGADEEWVDNILKSLNTEEKIGQLIMYAPEVDSTYSDEEILHLIKKYSIGSAILKEDSLNAHFQLIKKIQDSTKVPLIIANCSNNLLSDYLKDIPVFPSYEILNCVEVDSILDYYFSTISYNSDLLGTSLNFFYDIYKTNDTLMFDTTFIKSYFNKASKFSEYSYENKIINIVPFINFDDSDSLSNAFFNNIYDTLIVNGLCGFKFASDFSEKTEEFEKFTSEHKFTCLNFADYTETTDLHEFIKSDIDVLILKTDIESSIKDITSFINSKNSYEVDLDNKVRKILLAKSWAGLTTKNISNTDSAKLAINSGKSELAARYLYENSIILFRNSDTLLPLTKLYNKTISMYTLGAEKLNSLEEYSKFYTTLNTNFISNNEPGNNKTSETKFNSNTIIVAFNNFKPDTSFLNILKNLTDKNLIVINFGDLSNLELLTDFPTVIQSISNSEISQQYVAQLIFGGIEAQGITPYSISDFVKFGEGNKTSKIRLKYTTAEETGISSDYLEKIDSIVNAAINAGATPGCQVFVAKNGKVIYNKAFGKSSYFSPNLVKTTDLYDVASVTKVAATTLATMKMYEQGKISLDKEIGKYFKDTYIEYTHIKPDTIINIDTLELKDIKDIKKILAFQDTIHLNDSVIIAYDTIISMATPYLNIFKVTPRELLMHKSGIQPAMPILRFLFYVDYYIADYKKELLKRDTTGIDTAEVIINKIEFVTDAFERYYSNRYIKDSSEVQIARGMYINKSYEDTLWIDTKQLKNYSRKIYVYSDVNMILLQMTIDTINNYSIDKYLSSNFYSKLGLPSIGFLPLKRFSLTKIMPTENDGYWRGQLLQGYVHDPSAALLGGIAGNAGLFSSAQELGVIFQMLLNGGTYGGDRFLQASTINLFTQTQPDSYRGLGFDKWSKKNVIAADASENSYGHTGFTGCCVWVDPDEELVYVFLSNRVNPSVNNWRLNSLQVRQKVHQVVYDAIKEGF